MKNIALLFILLVFSVSSASAFSSSLAVSSNALLEIQNGAKYKTQINKLVNKYSTSLKKLEILKSRVEVVDAKIAKKTDRRSQLQRILLDYLYHALDAKIIKVKADKEAESQNNTGTNNGGSTTDNSTNTDSGSSNNSGNNTGIEQDSKNKVSYTGFSDFYDDTDKNILAGKDSYVYETSVRADLEYLDVRKIKVYFRGDDVSEFKNSVEQVGIYLEGKKVGTATSGNMEFKGGALVVTLSNLKDFILIEKKELDMRISVKPFEIGNNLNGSILEDLYVDRVDLDDIKGLTSGGNVDPVALYQDGEKFGIIPSGSRTLVTKEFSRNNGTAELYLKFDSGNNTKPDGSEINITLKGINFEMTSFRQEGDISVFNSTGNLIGTVTVTGNGSYLVDTSDLVSKKGETFTIETTAQGIIRISKDGLKLTDGDNEYTSKFENSLSLGQYSN